MENDLHNIDVTVDSIEKVLRSQTPQFDGSSKTDKVERYMRLPPISTAFYELVRGNTGVPTQQMLWNYYYVNYCSKFDEEDMPAIKARVLSTYPSLIRDIHLYCALRDSGLFEEVLYNHEADLHNDADIIVKRYDMWFCISLYVKTERSLFWRKKKEHRHNLLDGYTYIEVPFNMKTGRSVNNIKLYGEREIEYIIARTRYYKLLSMIKR